MRHFMPRPSYPRQPLNMRLCGPEACLDISGKGRFSWPYGDSNIGPWSLSLVTVPAELLRDCVTRGDTWGEINYMCVTPWPLGRPRRRWVDNIRMDLQEVGCGYMDRIGLAQDRDRWKMLVSAVMNFRVPWNAGNFLTSCKPVSFSRRILHRGVSKVGPLLVSHLNSCVLCRVCDAIM